MSTFTDPRDGNTYETIEINGKIWMAENLRYKGPIKKFNNWTIEEKDFYYPPGGDRKNIKEYGCLYTWENALKACPDGWHLPTKEELEKLLKAARNTEKKRLKALVARGWGGEFGLLPAGYYFGFVYFSIGCGARFWSSTEYSSSYAYSLDVDSSGAGMDYDKKTYGFSVRCIKD